MAKQAIASFEASARNGAKKHKKRLHTAASYGLDYITKV